MQARKRPVRVVHFSSVHRALDTRIFYRECLSLARAGYEVHLMAAHHKHEIKDGVEIHPLPLNTKRLRRFLLTGPSLFLKVWRLKPDICHFHDPELIPYGLWLRRMGIAVIYDIHENTAADLTAKEWLPARNWATNLFTHFDKKARQKLNLIIAERSYLALYQNSAQEVTLVQNFPDLAHWPVRESRFRADAGRLLLVGYLGGRRGLSTTLQALLILKKKGLTLYLTCVGPVNEAVADILAHSHAWPEVAEQVKFMGVLPVTEAYSLHEHYLAGLALPEDLPNHRESYPTKLFEYMACGLPVVASRFPLYQEVVEGAECGLCVDPEDAEKLVNALLSLHNDPKRTANMAANAQDAVKNYDWKTEEARLLALYSRLSGEVNA